MLVISELVTAFNSLDRNLVSLKAVTDTVKWVTYMVNLLGLNGDTGSDSELIGWSGVSIPEAAKPYIYPLSQVRDKLRHKARSEGGITQADLDLIKQLKDVASSKENPDTTIYQKIVNDFAGHLEKLKESQRLSNDILLLCDRVRDVDLWNQGIYLEDRPGNEPAIVRPVTKELLQTREEKEIRDQQKQKAKVEREREAAAKIEKGRQSHLDMYRTSEYSAWDAEGIPTKDSKGQDVVKSRSKKMRKDWERQKKLHETWLEAQE